MLDWLLNCILFLALLFPPNLSNAWQMEPFHHGPIDVSVLLEQDNHKSTSILKGKVYEAFIKILY